MTKTPDMVLLDLFLRFKQVPFSNYSDVVVSAAESRALLILFQCTGLWLGVNFKCKLLRLCIFLFLGRDCYSSFSSSISLPTLLILMLAQHSVPMHMVVSGVYFKFKLLLLCIEEADGYL